MYSWGFELKPGETKQILISEDEILHISQATLDVENNHVKEPASVRIEVGGKISALIALNPVKFPQQICDLVFERTITVSNKWANGSVVLSGYRTNQPAGEDDFLHGDFVYEEKKDESVPIPEIQKFLENKLDAKKVKDAIQEQVTKKDSDSGEGTSKPGAMPSGGD